MSFAREPLFVRLLDLTPFSERDLAILIATAPRRYKDHYIEKRNGRGKRLISQPTAELKFVQRLLIKHELTHLQLHEASVAYRSGSSIMDHASPHASARYLLKLDFKDFFPSLKASTLQYRFTKDSDYSENEKWILCQLLCRGSLITGDLQLSIGAPSSPYISNYLMWEFDTKLTEFCKKYSAEYTRYADDLAISTSQPHALDKIESEVRRLLMELSYLKLTLNEDKKVNVSKKNRRTLVSLRLANDGNVSVGRQRKRQLRAAMNALIHGRLSTAEISRFRGMMAFVYSIDPNFVDQLCSKNGFATISAIDAVKIKK
ncbi:MAG: RNA-directed DNA polymerase [Nitrosomonas sp. PRO4]|nr:RNA-directed DNA polymerase [Nitrosomonas sp. PRO4]